MTHIISDQGVLSSRGRFILMADADGATKFADIEKVEAALKALQPGPVSIALCLCICLICGKCSQFAANVIKPPENYLVPCCSFKCQRIELSAK